MNVFDDAAEEDNQPEQSSGKKRRGGKQSSATPAANKRVSIEPPSVARVTKEQMEELLNGSDSEEDVEGMENDGK